MERPIFDPQEESLSNADRRWRRAKFLDYNVEQVDKKAKRQTNAMVRHSNLYHRGREMNFRMSVVSLHKDPVSRLCREGVDIVAGNQDILLNSKEEFFQGAVPSTRTQRGFGR